MHFSTSITAISLASVAVAVPASNTASPTATDPADVYAAQATALTLSPTSHVKGKAFDRFVSIWFENTNYADVAADPNFQFFAKKGITLTNNFAVTHPSEPNYIAAVGGDYFGLDDDPFTTIPKNVSSIVDLLEDKGISWGLYQEDMPYSGYQGMTWVNRTTGDSDYVRKHNPEVLFNSVATSPNRLAHIKNTTLFYRDLASNTLPQWLFITPNMTNDGHDTDVTFAGNWLKTFLTPLLSNKNFMQKTLVLLTFDETWDYDCQNRVFTVLLGDAIPSELIGTEDSNFYTHYSEISSVEANWDLHTLGRYDVGSNIYSFLTPFTHDITCQFNSTPPLSQRYFNTSYPGFLSTTEGMWSPQPVPNTKLVRNGRTVLPAIRKMWEGEVGQTVYNGKVEIPDGMYPPVYPSV